MKNLTVQIISRGEETLKKTLDSIAPLGAEVVIGYIGDGDIDVDAEVIPLEYHQNMSDMRNKLIVEKGWQLYLNPGETIAYGLKDILRAIEGPPQSYRFPIFQGDMVTKQIRLWCGEQNLKFSNPIFECLVDNKAKDLNAILYSNTQTPPDAMECIKIWKEQFPTSPEPYYYEACVLLSQRRHDEFLTTAEQYLFRDKAKQMPVTMTRYYSAMVLCYVKKDAERAIKHLLACLSVKPLMAEFWCLLGDVYYHILKKYRKAKAFYENALILGKNRLQTDDWPMEIKKYKEFPAKMITSCDEIIARTRYMGVGNKCLHSFSYSK